MLTKAEVVAEAMKLGLTFNLKLTKIEIEALISDHKQKAAAVGEDEPKLKKDRISGLAALKRENLDHICNALGEVVNLPKHPRRAQQLRSKGHVLLEIRKIMETMEEDTMPLGKYAGVPYKELKTRTAYYEWMEKTIDDDSHPSWVKLHMYLRLWYGAETKKVTKEESDNEDSEEELMKDTPKFPQEPEWHEVKIGETWQTTGGRPVKSSPSNSGLKPVKPEKK